MKCKSVLERLLTAYLQTNACILDLFSVRQTSSTLHFLPVFGSEPLGISKYRKYYSKLRHLSRMVSSLSKPASVMQPASRSAMARIEPEGINGKRISLSSSGWKETSKQSTI